ncbi:MAG: S-methyl-5-thioribose-1-phosphate isomerase [Deltaproteobacteria bacterium]|nr:S-methyl-5-thioribose-1-phosphate isomerase [Deltaproteobacteria bacterium]
MTTVSSALAPLHWHAPEPALRILDQRALPAETIWQHCTAAEPVMQAIRTLAVRGAPAIGIAAAYGIVLGVRSGTQFDADLAQMCAQFAATRPTAVNLFWAIERMRVAGARTAGQPRPERLAALEAQAQCIAADDAQCCADIGRHGAPLLPDRGGVLTHCNAGALATGGIGTALGVIRTAVAMGKQLHVWIDETRPLLQGARLTAYEMAADGIAATLMCDNMAGHALKLGRIQAAVVGADRIARNGDSANKIGTYTVAVLCAHHGIPFYIAAPTSTVDLQCPDGDHIPIEERGAEEVTDPQGVRFAASGTAVFNPAFDVAPAALIAGIITEEGVARPPFSADLAAMVDRARARLDRRG